MNYEELNRLIDSIASDLLFLDEKLLDISSAGGFLNHLEHLMANIALWEVPPMERIACGLTNLLEKVVMDDVDPALGYRIFEEGVTLMQKITDSYLNSRSYQGDIKGYMVSLANIVGSDILEETENKECQVQADNLLEGEFNLPAEEVRMPVMEGDESLIRDFIVEGLEYIGEIEMNILNLEQEPENKEYINTIFRPFHSIKGVASFLNLEEIRDLSHELEDLLDQARSGELSVTPELIDVILSGSDSLKSLILHLQEKLDKSQTEPLSIDLVGIKRQIELIKAGPLAEDKVQKLGTILVEDGILTTEVLEETLQEIQATPAKKIGEVLVEEGKASPKEVAQALRKQRNQINEATTIRVDTKKLDDLIDMIGELVIAQSMIRQNPAISSSSDRKLLCDVSQLSSITSELQKASTSLRMVPIKQTFQRMARLVRDLAKSSGKMIAVDMQGEETEIDRNMVEEIYNPLVHMVRNSVDHGIEFPEERLKAGKSEKGHIYLRAYHRGGNIVIEISDDGRGLNKNKILRKAQNNSLIANGDGLSESEIYKLIFLPGFSTADQITDVSGRGVGMDVVKQSVEKLRGKIEINSIEGKGTTFSTLFPLTMAIIDGMIVKVGPQKYIVPAVSIRQLLRPNREAYNNIVGRGEMLKVMGRLLPLVRLHEIFGVEPKHESPWEALIVVIDAENKTKCLMVDEVIDKSEVVIKSLGDGLQNMVGISGGAILGDGTVGLILDPEGLFELGER